MLNAALVVARKEILDGLRDVRSLISAAVHTLMGPAVVGLVSLSGIARRGGGANAVLIDMMSIFALVAAFVGGMNIAMDTIAGERERRSLLPLLLNPVARADIAIGKWLAVSVFAGGGLALSLAGFVALFAAGLPGWRVLWVAALPLTAALLPLALLAASTQLLISTVCRGVKEAQTYLSLIAFVPMGIGITLAFVPAHGAWRNLLPIIGQQFQIEHFMNGGHVSWVEAVRLAYLTLAVAVLLLWIAAARLQRDEIVYGS